jgi:hypothetical protein
MARKGRQQQHDCKMDDTPPIGKRSERLTYRPSTSIMIESFHIYEMQTTTQRGADIGAVGLPKTRHL